MYHTLSIFRREFQRLALCVCEHTHAHTLACIRCYYSQVGVTGIEPAFLRLKVCCKDQRLLHPRRSYVLRSGGRIRTPNCRGAKTRRLYRSATPERVLLRSGGRTRTYNLLGQNQAHRQLCYPGKSIQAWGCRRYEATDQARLFSLWVGPSSFMCVPGRIRTCDPWLRKPVFFPLNYRDKLEVAGRLRSPTTL